MYQLIFSPDPHTLDVISKLPYNHQIQAALLNVAIFAIIEFGGLLLVYILLTGKSKFNLSLRSKIKIFLVFCLSVFIAMSIVPVIYYLFIYPPIYNGTSHYVTGIKSIPYWMNYIFASSHNIDKSSRILVITKLWLMYLQQAIIDTLILFVIVYHFRDNHNSSIDQEKGTGSQILYPSTSK